MGLAMGMGWYGLSFGEAIETYAILTVGDGLVSQIPAVIISIAAALLLSKGGSLGSADVAIVDQLTAYPSALITVGGLMAMFAFAPGLPFGPFIIGAAGLILGGWFSFRRQQQKPTTRARPRRRCAKRQSGRTQEHARRSHRRR